MIGTKSILEAMAPVVGELGCFIVETTVSKDNDITISIEKETGDVDLADCEKVNDAFIAAFDREAEDYSLTVSSAGLDQPFKVAGQYTKAIGSQVEVRLKGGRKLIGVLVSSDGSGIVLQYSQKETVEGMKKKKVIVEHEDAFSFDEINTVTPHIVFTK